MEDGDDKEGFEHPKSLSYPNLMDICFMIKTIEEEISKSTKELDNDDIEKLMEEGLRDCYKEELAFDDLLDCLCSVEKIDKERSTPPEVELKL